MCFVFVEIIVIIILVLRYINSTLAVCYSTALVLRWLAYYSIHLPAVRMEVCGSCIRLHCLGDVARWCGEGRQK